MLYLIVLLIAFVLSLLFTPLAMRLGHRWGLVDQPGGRRKHRGVIPRTGGIALYAAFTLTVLLISGLPFLLPAAADWLPPRNDPDEIRRLTALLAGLTFCVVFGLLDDRYEFSALPQYTVQLVAALIAIAGLIFIKHVNNPLGPGFLYDAEAGFPWWIVLPLTVFWFMGMMNTVNWLDGLSGLVVGITAILCAILAIHMLFAAEPPQLSVAVLPIALLGAALGFLPFNFGPARIFMGSSGSYILGFALAALGIIGGARLAAVLLVIGLPALDVAWLIFSRWRRGVSPGQGGRDHLHFRLLDIGLSERTIVIGYWLFCALFGGLTLLLDDRIYKLVALLGMAAVGLGVLIWAGQPHEEKQRAL
jgi:UDP-GlcNAc:undecaprenyl-phosphate/decaprenyl-phosphate GlcNAc-1-phosphate transferase